MYDIELSVSPAVDFLRDLRQKVLAVRGPIFDELKGPIRDDVLSAVNQRIAPYVPPAVHPFDFSTDKSMRWYLWAKRTGQMPGQAWDNADGGWQRTDTLHDAWAVEVDVRQNEGFVQVTNRATDYKGDNYGQAIYGPDPVPGHENTGWGEGVDAAVDQIADDVAERLADALEAAMSGFKV